MIVGSDSSVRAPGSVEVTGLTDLTADSSRGTETVSRTFTQLKQGGSVSLLQGVKVELVDRARLEEIAEGG